MYFIEDILNDSVGMNDFMQQLNHYNITNRDGADIGKKLFCYWKGGILLVRRYFIGDQCDIFIASNRSAKCLPGCQNTHTKGNPFPSLDRGEFIRVWNNGSWVKKGPWEKHITELIVKLISTLEEKREEEERQIKRENKQVKEQIIKEERALIKEWSQ